MRRVNYPERRVVITGIGLISPLGTGTDKNWQALLRGESGIAPLTRFDMSRYATRFGGEVKDFDPLVFIDRKEVRKMDPFIRFGLAAAELAVADSGIDRADLRSDRAGTYVGSGIGGLGSIEENLKVLWEKGPERVSPFFLIQTIINEASGQISIRFGAKGPNCANATACSTGTHALGDSARIIARGEADIMIAGGAEAPLTPLSLAGFNSIKAISERNDEPAKASRPFDAKRDGFVMGEGAGVLILEELGRALKRDARIYAELVGYGMTSDAYHAAAPAPDGDGAIRVMLRALEDAEIGPDGIQYINAHGTSTELNDKTETAAIKAVFGEHARKLAVNSTKSMTGHLLGAAGGLEAGITALAVHHQIMPPTINYEFPDPDCDLDYVPNTARKAEIVHGLSNSFGFGGTNASIILKRFDRP
ncbi:MAG: beta-ketoacyl-acyl carrier protein synthase [Candidatus Aminicenantes bacterium]|jgi:3-oxoacyl-[acyl-carrier-protein] synthase II|nr:beta-ketoacyl-acyl carrier protein synthase [Candidatus Aminicenantes bacterium]